MASNDIPCCRYCSQPYQLVRETSDFWEMACETCKVGHVFSKPRAKAAGRYQANLQRKLEIARRVKEWESRPRSVFIDSTKTSKGVN
jgi:hypothetical protein